MESICESGYLKSMDVLIAERILTYRPECAEIVLGTTNAVFFYVGGFSYPATTFGFLFKTSLETQNRTQGSATPFDSGGLVAHFQWPEKLSESPREFFARHELPIPEHRQYLSAAMARLYPQPEGYLDPPTDGLQMNPLGLSGGDSKRRGIHEVRIPDRVLLRSPELLAVFAPKSRVGAFPHARKLFRWCLGNGVDRVYFDEIGGEDFAGLRSVCLNYLRKRIY